MKKSTTLILLCTMALSLTGCSNSSTPSETTTYLGEITIEENNLVFDEIEWIDMKDTDRMKELNLTAEDIPNGYHIHNESPDTRSYPLAEDVSYTFYDVSNLFVEENQDRKYTTNSQEEFATFLYQYGEATRAPFHIEVQDGEVISITEQFVN